MKDWCREHPWLTFFICLALLDCIQTVCGAR